LTKAARPSQYLVVLPRVPVGVGLAIVEGLDIRFAGDTGKKIPNRPSLQPVAQIGRASSVAS
jgi:hypothetical protein